MKEGNEELRDVPLLDTGPIQLGDNPIAEHYVIQHPQANRMISKEDIDKYGEIFADLKKEGMDIARVMAVLMLL